MISISNLIFLSIAVIVGVCLISISVAVVRTHENILVMDKRISNLKSKTDLLDKSLYNYGVGFKGLEYEIEQIKGRLAVIEDTLNSEIH